MNFLAGLQTKLIVSGGVLLLIRALITRNRALREKADDLADYKETKQRAAQADVSRGSFDDDVDWLHNRSLGSGSSPRRTESVDSGARIAPSDRNTKTGYTEW